MHPNCNHEIKPVKLGYSRQKTFAEINFEVSQSMQAFARLIGGVFGNQKPKNHHHRRIKLWMGK